MFWNLYGKGLIGKFRNRDTLIWTWIFPLLLATLFYTMFSSLDSAGSFREIPLGVLDDAAYQQSDTLRSALESSSGEGGLFILTSFSDAVSADKALENGEIDGYITAGEVPRFAVKEDGINQTIIKGFLDNVVQTQNSVSELLKQNPSEAGQLAELLDRVGYTERISLSHNPPSEKVSFFYALLAMVCMYGGFQGMSSILYLQANLTPLGARRTMAPIGRFRAMVCELLSAATVHFTCLLVVVAYIIFVLKTEFGPNLGLVLLTCLCGSLLGVAFGAMVSAVSKLKEMAKTAIMVCVTMVCSFLSGLMMSGINYVVAQKAPLVSYLNPAARIADALYCLYYYDTYGRYFMNIGIVLAMALVMFAVTAIFVGRQRYESI